MEQVMRIMNSDGASHKKDNNIHAELNHVYFYSEVDRDSVHELINLLREAEEYCMITCRATSIKSMPIYLHVNSFGGCIFSAFNAIDYMNACKVPVYTIIEGATASAGTLISIVAEKRYIQPNAHMLIHQLSAGCWGKMSEIEDEFQNLNDLMGKIKNFYKNYAKIPKKELTKILKHDLWFDADKCLKYNLVDEIWTK
jgi:ATP-dependent Clp protease protease subunit